MKETQVEYETTEITKTALFCDNHSDAENEWCEGMVGYEEDGAKLIPVYADIEVKHHNHNGRKTIRGEKIREVCETCRQAMRPDESPQYTQLETVLPEPASRRQKRTMRESKASMGRVAFILFGVLVLTAIPIVEGASPIIMFAILWASVLVVNVYLELKSYYLGKEIEEM